MADHDTHDHTGVTGVPSASAPNPTTIELGHASDTTLARVSAGVVSIEGTNIVKAGAVTTSGLTQATAKLLGRNTASTGAVEEITLGTNLSFTGTTLNAAGGGAAAIATDTIWDAAGDLVQGTGADTGAKLSLGTAAFGLVSTGSAAAWAEVLPWRIQIIPQISTPDASTGTWGLNTYTDQLAFPFYVPGSAANSGGGSEFANAATNAQNDAISYNVVLAKGTWDCNIWVRKTSVSAIITLNQDGASQGTVDTYAASPAAAKVSITGWTVSTSGLHVMQFIAATKNASSSDYYLLLHGIEFRRTA